MKFKIALMIPVLLVSHFGFAKKQGAEKNNNRKFSSPWCEAKKMSIPSKNLSQIKNQLDSLPRTQLIQAMWLESSSKNPSPQVLPLLQYLAYTEQSSPLSGYYQAIAIALGVSDSIDEEMQRWPQASKLKALNTNIKELCRLYELAGGRDFLRGNE
ncbi:MAG: hypothetical protein V4654_02665 [Bdellovibrionota bacterium]